MKKSIFLRTNTSSFKRMLSLCFTGLVVLSAVLFAACAAIFTRSLGFSARATAVLCAVFLIYLLLCAAAYRLFVSPLYKAYDDITCAAKEMGDGNLDCSMNAESQKQLIELSQSLMAVGSNLNNYIYEISGVLSHLSAGDMAVSLTAAQQYNGDFMPIKNALTKITASLNQTFSEINALVQNLARVSQQLKHSAGALAQGSSEQTQDIGNLSEVVADINMHTANNASNAGLAAQSALEAKENATSGNEYMHQLLASMDEIGTASNDISTIIKLIDNISFQTNVLALNASVEAARAGAAGKGFAVVANEVKSLALKSADAAKRTEELIRTSIDKVKEGSQIAGKTADVFEEIKASIDITSDLSSKIASLSLTQAEAIKQTTIIISGISEVVENNAANAQEVSAISDTLSRQAEGLKTLISRFRLKGARNLKLEAEKTAKLDETAYALMATLKGRLATTDFSQYDRLIKDVVDSAANIECIYIISTSGVQTSDTVMSTAAAATLSEDFKPAQKGDNHSKKKYFTRALKRGDEVYKSEEYISGATGGLCRTYSSVCNTAQGGESVICIDVQCLI